MSSSLDAVSVSADTFIDILPVKATKIPAISSKTGRDDHGCLCDTHNAYDRHRFRVASDFRHKRQDTSKMLMIRYEL